MRSPGRVSDEVLSEVRTMCARRHCFVLPLLSAFVIASDSSKATLFMVTPYAQGGDMYEWIGVERSGQSPPNPPSMDDIAVRSDFIFRSIAYLSEALAYLHSKIEGQWCGHFDIKPRNILLFHESGLWNWKLSDFGLSKLRSSDMKGTTQEIGTDEYQPPEYHTSSAGTSYGPSFDVWSLGCVFLELLTIRIISWNRNQVSRMKKDMSSCPSADFKFRAPSNIPSWVDYLLKETDDIRIIRAIHIVQKMLTIESQNWLYAFDAAIDLLELYEPEIGIGEFEKKCRALTKGQSPSPSFGQFYDPVVRTSRDPKHRRKHFIQPRLQCLNEAIWPSRPGILRSATFISRQSSEALFTTLPSHYKEDRLHGHEELLETMRTLFAFTSCIALVGIGGIGKSHLAWTYASKTRESALAAGNSVNTFWVRCRNESAFTASYADIAQAGGLTVIRQSTSTVRRTVKKWLLGLKQHWILVLDGLENAHAKWFSDFCPFQEGAKQFGKMIITTKSMEVGDICCSQPQNILQVEVDSLKVEDGVSLLLQGIESIGPYDRQEAEPLVRKLVLPVLIKLIGREIQRHRRGGKTISDFTKQLSSGEKLVDELRRLDPRDPEFQELRAAKRVYKIVSGDFLKGDFLEPVFRDIFKMVCCLASDSIDRVWMENEFRSKESAQEAISLFVGRGYLTPSGGLDESQYATYNIIQSMFRAWMATCSSNIKRDLWSAYGRALWTVYYDYRRVNKPTIVVNDHGESLETRHPPSHLIKLRYIDHVEEFLKYVSCHDISSLKFKKHAAHALITFARCFEAENRFEVGRRLLRLVIDQGVKNDVECKTELQARRDLISSLTIEASGRTKTHSLRAAIDESEIALKRALEAGGKIDICKIRRERVYTLCRMDRNAAAIVELNLLKKLVNDPSPDQRDQHNLQHSLDQGEAKCFETQTKVDKDPEMSKKVKQAYDRCVDHLERSQVDGKYKLAEQLHRARRRRAEACLAMMNNLEFSADTDALARKQGKKVGDAAWDEFHDLWRERENSYRAEKRDFGLHKHVIDAR